LNCVCWIKVEKKFIEDLVGIPNGKNLKLFYIIIYAYCMSCLLIYIVY